MEKLAEHLRDTNIPLDARIRELISSQGLTFTNKAWLGETLLESVTEEERVGFGEKIGQLERLVSSWRSRGS